jgi:hypothetical protein
VTYQRGYLLCGLTTYFVYITFMDQAFTLSEITAGASDKTRITYGPDEVVDLVLAYVTGEPRLKSPARCGGYG